MTVAFLLGSLIPSPFISLKLRDIQIRDRIVAKLHLMDLRVGVVGKISDEEVIDVPIWSQDGTRIAFRGGNGQLFAWDMRDGATKQIIASDFDVASLVGWSPDGQYIIFYHRQIPANELYVVKLDDGHLSKLPFFEDVFLSYDIDYFPADNGNSFIALSGERDMNRSHFKNAY